MSSSSTMRDEELTTISSREVGARMRRARTERGLTTAEVAGKVGVTEEMLSAWEGGQGVAPYDTMTAIASVLGTSIDVFLA
jgi:transcriptional regulator with XRE-family HTH domain